MSDKDLAGNEYVPSMTVSTSIDHDAEIPADERTGSADYSMALLCKQDKEQMNRIEKMLNIQNSKNENLIKKAEELISGVRTVNQSSYHVVDNVDDDEPCFWQREEWIKWILKLADDLEKQLADNSEQEG